MILHTDRDGRCFVIDEADLEAVSRYTWRINRDGYPETTTGKWPDCRSIPLHLFLLGPAPDGLEWDHINRQRLDNRRRNLRAVTHKVNTRNFGIRSTNKSGIPGVALRRGRWRAEITVDGRSRHLGCFPTREAAAEARRAAERALWGSA